MKKSLSKIWKIGLTLLFGLVVFLFWRFRYPFALAYQEQLQLFLFDDDYFWKRLSEPGGLARYIAEFLVQFYNSVTMGAAIIAILMMLLQRLTWQLMRCEEHYCLSFLPAILLWYAMGDESVMLTYTVALVMSMASAWALMTAFPKNDNPRGQIIAKSIALFILIPIIYWLIGPMVILVALCVMPVSLIWALAVMLISTHFVPFPMSRVMLGISYYRFPETMPYVLIAIPALIWILSIAIRLLPKQKSWVRYSEALALGALVSGIPDMGYDSKKYELLEYDYLVRIKDWQGIIAKAEKKTPDLPMSVSATNLALAMTNQLGERAFDFYQRTSEGLLPKFERNYATSQLSGEIYFHLGLVNTAQRFAFEAMEAIPNYNKSARVVKRLAETNLINGEYEVARKYLQMLEKTIFYRPWAKRTMAMLGDEKQIDSHPLYGTLRQYRLQEDFLYSEDELDKICGHLFMHNKKNQMAAQYLVMVPLLDRDIPRFISYVQVVQNAIAYNPRAVQEGIAFAFMQKRQQPPQGLVSQPTLQRLNDFARTYSANNSSPELERFRNTAWYYLTVGK
jgi:ABC-type multidrug transport system fused ATPase/permease subunit